MNQNKKFGVIALLFVGIALAAGTIAGTYFGVPEFAVLANDSAGMLAIAFVVIVGGIVALTKPVIFKWFFIGVAVVFLGAALYGVLLSEDSEHQLLGGLVLFGGFLAVVGSALQWHNARMQDSPRYQNIVGWNVAFFLIATFAAAAAQSFFVGVVAFIGLWVLAIAIAIAARKAKNAVEKKLHR